LIIEISGNWKSEIIVARKKLFNQVDLRQSSPREAREAREQTKGIVSSIVPRLLNKSSSSHRDCRLSRFLFPRGAGGLNFERRLVPYDAYRVSGIVLSACWGNKTVREKGRGGEEGREGGREEEKRERKQRAKWGALMNFLIKPEQHRAASRYYYLLHRSIQRIAVAARRLANNKTVLCLILMNIHLCPMRSVPVQRERERERERKERKREKGRGTGRGNLGESRVFRVSLATQRAAAFFNWQIGKGKRENKISPYIPRCASPAKCSAVSFSFRWNVHPSWRVINPSNARSRTESQIRKSRFVSGNSVTPPLPLPLSLSLSLSLCLSLSREGITGSSPLLVWDLDIKCWLRARHSAEGIDCNFCRNNCIRAVRVQEWPIVFIVKLVERTSFLGVRNFKIDGRAMSNENKDR
jgi:hypothetical protein